MRPSQNAQQHDTEIDLLVLQMLLPRALHCVHFNGFSLTGARRCQCQRPPHCLHLLLSHWCRRCCCCHIFYSSSSAIGASKCCCCYSFCTRSSDAIFCAVLNTDVHCYTALAPATQAHTVFSQIWKIVLSTQIVYIQNFVVLKNSFVCCTRIHFSYKECTLCKISCTIFCTIRGSLQKKRGREVIFCTKRLPTL